jgi:Uma2 family endonuclease
MIQGLSVLLYLAAPKGIYVLQTPSLRPGGSMHTELQPDLLVAPSSEFVGGYLPTAPLLVVEALSPSTRNVDLGKKKQAYEEMGTASYWVLDPDVLDLRVWELNEHGVDNLVAHVRDEEEFHAERPFPVTVRPSELVDPNGVRP